MHAIVAALNAKDGGACVRPCVCARGRGVFEPLHAPGGAGDTLPAPELARLQEQVQASVMFLASLADAHGAPVDADAAKIAACLPREAVPPEMAAVVDAAERQRGLREQQQAAAAARAAAVAAAAVPVSPAPLASVYGGETDDDATPQTSRS